MQTCKFKDLATGCNFRFADLSISLVYAKTGDNTFSMVGTTCTIDLRNMAAEQRGWYLNRPVSYN